MNNLLLLTYDLGRQRKEEKEKKKKKRKPQRKKNAAAKLLGRKTAHSTESATGVTSSTKPQPKIPTLTFI